MSSCHCFQQMHLEPSPQEPIARETFLNFHHQKEAIKLTYMNGSTLANSTPAILEVCIVRFGKALFHCSMDRNVCHDTPSHGCRVGKRSCKRHLKSKKACPIKVYQSHMPHGFPFCRAHEKTIDHPFIPDLRLHGRKAATCRTQGVADNGLSFQSQRP